MDPPVKNILISYALVCCRILIDSLYHGRGVNQTFFGMYFRKLRTAYLFSILCWLR